MILRLVVRVVFLFYAGTAFGQTATVVRNVNLRPTPSTVEDSKRLLIPPEVLTLLSPAKDEGYYKVRTSDGLEGFVWGANVRLDAPAPTAPSALAVTPMSVPAGLPTLPDCDMPDSTKSRWTMKSRSRPPGASEQTLSVAQMIQWAVPFNLSSDARTQNTPIHTRETQATVYRLTGFVRVVKLQDNDCEFHVEVASTAVEGAPRVIVEIPQHEEGAARQLMAFVECRVVPNRRTSRPPRRFAYSSSGWRFLISGTRQTRRPRKVTVMGSLAK